MKMNLQRKTLREEDPLAGVKHPLWVDCPVHGKMDFRDYLDRGFYDYTHNNGVLVDARFPHGE